MNDQTEVSKRNSLMCLAMVFVIILLGLFSRSSFFPPGGLVKSYLGDSLWAMMVLFLIAAIFPGAESNKIMLGAISFAFLIEFSQLYQEPWLNQIRANRFAALILGRGFLVSDLFCYSVGIFLGGLIERRLSEKFSAKSKV